MKTDVQTLIAALTTERNSLDRAIVALQAISGNGATAQTAPKSTSGPIKHRRPAPRRKPLSEEAKADIVARLTRAADTFGGITAMSRVLAREYGANAGSLLTNWRMWQRNMVASGASHAPAVSVVEPELTTV